MKCPIANPNCPIKNGSKSPPCNEAGCTYTEGNPLAATVGTVAIAGAIATGGYFIFKDKIDPGAKPTPTTTIAVTPTTTSTFSASPTTTAPTTTASPTITSTPTPSPTIDIATIESIDTSQPNPQVLTMDGSVTMVKMVKLLRNGYAQVNPNIPTTYGFDINGQPKDGEDVRPTGSSSGLKNLIDGKVLMVATSRALKPDEAKAGIKVIPIARDAIAIVVGRDNPFQGSLTKAQLRDIYTGKITNWSEVGGANLPIKVFNRSPDSGTQGFFKDDVLLDAKFAPEGENFKTWERDETTAVLRVLGSNGIYYTTVSQTVRQDTIRVVPIDGISPENRKAILDRTYPIIRDVYLAVPKQTSPAVKQFIEFALSSDGQRIVEQAEFIRLK
ncbi:MAG: phosphate ABC transporter substrate-binding protein [Pseudanabaena sp.]